MRIVEKVFVLIAIVALSSCADTPSPGQAEGVVDLTGSDQCNVYESRDWLIELKPSGAGGLYTLRVTGEVDLPSPAYQAHLRMGITDRAFPPGLRIILASTVKKDVASIQVITPQKVAIKEDVRFSQYRSVDIYCGDRLIKAFGSVTAGK